MKFGPVSPRDALGGTAVHSIRQGSLVLKKGTVIGEREVAALEEAPRRRIPETAIVSRSPEGIYLGREHDTLVRARRVAGVAR